MRQGIGVFQIPSCAVAWHSSSSSWGTSNPNGAYLLFLCSWAYIRWQLATDIQGKHAATAATCREISVYSGLPAHPASPSTCCLSHCFCELFLPFPASLKWKEWEKQIWSKATIKWLQRRESLWTHKNHCRRGGTRTGSKALSSSAELLSKQGTPTEVPFTLPHVTSLYTRTQSSLTAISLCLLFHKKLCAPKFWLLQLLLPLIYTVTTHHRA